MSTSECDDGIFISLAVYFFLTATVLLLYGIYKLQTSSKIETVLPTWLISCCLASRQNRTQNSQGVSAAERDRYPGQKESWQINPKELRFGQLLGKGNVGEVYEGYYRGQRVAIKKLLGNWFDDEEMVERFRDEIYLMSTMHHPNVLLFIGAVVNPQAGDLSLVTEVCGQGDLSSYLHSSNPMDWHTRIGMAADIARGMHYLHCRAGVIQRDLKSANLLIDDYRTVKIADFGLSRQLQPIGQMETYCGTPATMAPEVVRQEAYDEKADVFSFAIILWELLTREDPYVGRAGLGLAFAVANEGLRPPIPSYCPLEYAHLMSRCWRHTPSQRPSFDEVLDVLQLMQQMMDAQLRLHHTSHRTRAQLGQRPFAMTVRTQPTEETSKENILDRFNRTTKGHPLNTQIESLNTNTVVPKSDATAPTTTATRTYDETGISSKAATARSPDTTTTTTTTATSSKAITTTQIFTSTTSTHSNIAAPGQIHSVVEHPVHVHIISHHESNKPSLSLQHASGYHSAPGSPRQTRPPKRTGLPNQTEHTYLTGPSRQTELTGPSRQTEQTELTGPPGQTEQTKPPRQSEQMEQTRPPPQRTQNAPRRYNSYSQQSLDGSDTTGGDHHSIQTNRQMQSESMLDVVPRIRLERDTSRPLLEPLPKVLLANRDRIQDIHRSATSRLGHVVINTSNEQDDTSVGASSPSGSGIHATKFASFSSTQSIHVERRSSMRGEVEIQRALERREATETMLRQFVLAADSSSSPAHIEAHSEPTNIHRDIHESATTRNVQSIHGGNNEHDMMNQHETTSELINITRSRTPPSTNDSFVEPPASPPLRADAFDLAVRQLHLSTSTNGLHGHRRSSANVRSPSKLRLESSATALGHGSMHTRSRTQLDLTTSVQSHSHTTSRSLRQDDTHGQNRSSRSSTRLTQQRNYKHF